MPLLSLIRFVTTLLSLALLGAAGYLLWSWYDGHWVQEARGALRLERDNWRLWTGAGLLAWSFLGRFILPFLLARRDARPTRAERGDGHMIVSPTGSSLYVEIDGPAGAPTIVLTHGWGMDSTFWRYAKLDLGDRFRLVLWDLPGLGKSRTGSKAALSLDAFARDLATVLEASGRGRAVLVGHSIGGMTIQTLMRDHPQLQDRIAGLILLNTTYTNPLETMVLSRPLRALQRPLLEPAMKLVMALGPLVWLSKWQSYLSGSAHLANRFGFGRCVTRSQLEHTTLLSTRGDPAALARGDLAMFHWDATAALRHARTPVLVIGGDADIVTKLEASRAIAEQTDMASLRVVPGVNHMGPMERADLYNSLIADFVLQVQPGVSADDRPTRPDGADRQPPWREASGEASAIRH